MAISLSVAPQILSYVSEQLSLVGCSGSSHDARKTAGGLQDRENRPVLQGTYLLADTAEGQKALVLRSPPGTDFFGKEKS